jgi:pimeloyl-ACP methyl ester carboxylesterase
MGTTHAFVRARALLIAGSLVLAALMFAANASADSGLPDGFNSTPASENAKFPSVEVTAVTISAPLPATFGPHPAACDNLSFLRFRDKGGPTNPSDADKVLMAQPGILEGASAFQGVASNLVARAAAERGQHIEFWAIDRRANCLEDINGLLLGKATRDSKKMIDYYYKGASYRGSKFAGFYKAGSAQTKWMARLGLDQTVKDWNEVITRGIPDQSTRQQKVYCGGHSLGGLIAATYAEYDFDGDPATTADAGYNQCGGYFGLDTFISDDAFKVRALAPALGLSQLTSGLVGAYDTLLKSGAVAPYLSLPGINPEIMYLLTGLGAASTFDPTTESDLVDYLPANGDVKFAYREYFSKDLLTFLTGSPGLKDFRMTNQALLGTFMDDNAQPLSIVQSSVGMYDGPVSPKDFPFPNVIAKAPGLEWLTNGILGTGHLAIPNDYGRHCWLVFCWYQAGTGPLYKWRNYDQVATGSFTAPAKENTDINDLAQSLSATPLNFLEVYFPLKLALDTFSAIGGPTSAIPGAIHRDGVAAHPVLDIYTGDGPMRELGKVVETGAPVIPGYQHLDVLTAAPVQNDGRQEQTTTRLLDFIN